MYASKVCGVCGGLHNSCDVILLNRVRYLGFMKEISLPTDSINPMYPLHEKVILGESYKSSSDHTAVSGVVDVS